ncbi:hypothetical protein ACQPRD_004147 [Yersinia enterocolitica]
MLISLCLAHSKTPTVVSSLLWGIGGGGELLGFFFVSWFYYLTIYSAAFLALSVS